MQDFTIALVQHASPVGRTRENLAATVAWARKAKKKGAELVCFPNFPDMSRCLAVEGVDGAELIVAAHAARFGRW